MTVTAEAVTRLDQVWEELDPAEVAALARKAAELGPHPPQKKGPSQTELAAAEIQALCDGLCAACGKRPDDNLKSCSGCMATSYCGAACQKAAWKTHKRLCAKPGSTANFTSEQKQASKRAMTLFKASLGGNVQHMSALVERGQISLNELSSTGNAGSSPPLPPPPPLSSLVSWFPRGASHASLLAAPAPPPTHCIPAVPRPSPGIIRKRASLSQSMHRSGCNPLPLTLACPQQDRQHCITPCVLGAPIW